MIDLVAALLPLSTNPILQRAAPPQGPDTPPLKHAHVLKRPNAKRQTLRMLNVANAARELGSLPEPNETFHVVMRGNFHGWDLVPAVLRLAAPATIKYLLVATLGFNKQNATELLELLDTGKIARVTFLCSIYFQRSCPDEFNMLDAGLRQRSHRLSATRSHAKILAMELSNGAKLVVESSANLRSCRNIEQFAMTRSDELYEFHKAWIEEVTTSTSTHADSDAGQQRRN